MFIFSEVTDKPASKQRKKEFSQRSNEIHQPQTDFPVNCRVQYHINRNQKQKQNRSHHQPCKRGFFIADIEAPQKKYKQNDYIFISTSSSLP